MSEFMFDVSIVLNLHNEARYLRRTMRSLEDAMQFAKRYDISFELVAVLDRADAATREWVDRYDFGAFDGHQVRIVDNGSLGPSRNDGIAIARGEYISTADGDDLVSYNFFHECYIAARSAQRASLVFPEYLFGFGDKYYIWRFYGLDKISKLTFLQYHPYISRVFAHSHIFKKLRYHNSAPGSKFAYEDWHFNCEALAQTFGVAIAPQTILFYRQRGGSLLRQADAGSSRTIAPSRFFHPATFIKECASDYALLQSNRPTDQLAMRDVKKEALSSDVLMEFVTSANRIEPSISRSRFVDGAEGSNAEGNSAVGAHYFRLSKLVGAQNFTDVVLLPFLTAGGAEKYILDTLNGLRQLGVCRHTLVLCGQHIDRHLWMDKLPSGSTFIDLVSHCTGSPGETVDLIALKLIQSSAQGARVHLKGSPFAERFFRRYGALLDMNQIIFYYFCDPISRRKVAAEVDGHNFGFLSDLGASIDLVISDHRKILSDFCVLVDGECKTRYEHLYARAAISSPRTQASKGELGRSNRLLWASRLDAQKRPDLLMAIAHALRANVPDVTIDVYGSVVLDSFDFAQLKTCPQLNYRGPFTDFGKLPEGGYDAFLYTTAFDGLPNVILEAMGAGLPVIAPDVGGIGEAVNAETGFLVEHCLNDDVLLGRYLDAVAALYDRVSDVEGKRRNALRLIQERHSEDAYLKRLAEIFELPCKPQHAEAAE